MKVTLLEYIRSDELKLPFKHLKVGKMFYRSHNGKKREFKKIARIKDSRGKYHNCNLCGTKQLFTIDNDEMITVKTHNINQNLANLFKFKLTDDAETRKTLWEDENVEVYALVTEDTMNTYVQNKKGGFVKNISKGAKSLFTNPFAATGIALGVTDAIKRYRKNKRLTTRFYASDTTEKRFYEKLIDDLLKTGNYTLVKTEYVDSTWIFELKRHTL